MDFEQISLDWIKKSRGQKWAKYPDDVIACDVADMDFPVAEPIQAYLRQVAERGDLNYVASVPVDPIAEVFSDRMQQRHQWCINPDDVTDFVDIVQAVHLAIMMFCEPDEQIILQTPMYHCILQACESLNRKILFNSLINDGDQWLIDFDHLESSITSKTRLFILVNPHNPSGKAYTRSELQRLAEVVLKHDLIVIADEIHSDLVFSDGGEHIPFASLGKEVSDRTITFNSATKSHNLGGVRCALGHFSGKKIRQRFDSLPRRVRGGSNVIGHATTRIAWTQCDDWLDHLRGYLQGNRDFIAEYVRHSMPGVKHIPNQSTFLAWLDCTELQLPVEATQYFLQQARIGPSAGPMFGVEGRGHIRVNFATTRTVLEMVLDRMAEAIASRS